MNALLNIRDNQFNIFLQGLYFNKNCSYVYIGLLCMSLILIAVTIFDGFTIADSLLFIILELLMNLIILFDFICRLKLAGFKKFYRSNQGKYRCCNFFDTFVVVTCIILFMIAVTS